MNNNLSSEFSSDNREELRSDLENLLPQETREALSLLYIKCADISESESLIRVQERHLDSEKATKDDSPHRYEAILRDLKNMAGDIRSLKELVDDPKINAFIESFPERD